MENVQYVYQPQYSLSPYNVLFLTSDYSAG